MGASTDSVQDGLNCDGFVGGNPETATDPSGHCIACGPGNCDERPRSMAGEQWWDELSMRRAVEARARLLRTPNNTPETSMSNRDLLIALALVYVCLGGITVSNVVRGPQSARFHSIFALALLLIVGTTVGQTLAESGGFDARTLDSAAPFGYVVVVGGGLTVLGSVVVNRVGGMWRTRRRQE